MDWRRWAGGGVGGGVCGVEWTGDAGREAASGAVSADDCVHASCVCAGVYQLSSLFRCPSYHSLRRRHSSTPSSSSCHAHTENLQAVFDLPGELEGVNPPPTC